MRDFWEETSRKQRPNQTMQKGRAHKDSCEAASAEPDKRRFMRFMRFTLPGRR